MRPVRWVEGYPAWRAVRFVTGDHIELLGESCTRFEALLDQHDVVPLVSHISDDSVANGSESGLRAG